MGRLSEDGMKGWMLFKLKNRGKIGKNHTPAEFIYSIGKSHQTGTFKKLVKDLVREGVLLDHGKNYKAYSINVGMLWRVYEYIEIFKEESK